jgi:phage gp37-like protein
VLITEIEDALIARLKSKVPQLQVDSFPDKPSEFRLLHPKGAILVRYQGSKYSEPQTMGAVVQGRAVEFDIILVMRNLRDHAGIYAHLDAVRLALTGYRVPGCEKFYLTREEFIDETDGIWQYGIRVATELPNVELPEDEVLPLLKKATATDQYGTAEVIK